MSDVLSWLPYILSTVAVLLSLYALALARRAKARYDMARVTLLARLAARDATIVQLRRALEQPKRTDPAPSFSARALEDRARGLE